MAGVAKVKGGMDLFHNDPFGFVMKTPVQWKKNKTKPIVVRDTIARVVRPRAAPEVMVKVKRGGKSIGHIVAHLDYITRNGQLNGETERGEIVQGKEHVRAIVDEWASQPESVMPGSRNTINTILSMPPGTEPEGVRLAVREFARQELSNYQYVFVLHTDDSHPHVHLSIRTLGVDGRKLDPRKDDLQVWREVFAEKLRAQGIDAQATYRPSRGIVKKPLGMAQYKAKNWQAESDRAQIGKQKKRESLDRVGIRSIPQDVFTAVMDRDIHTYSDFVELLKTYGTVERRDAGRLTEHMSVKPLGADRAALLKDFVFTQAFIELDARAKRQALAARLVTKKGFNYGEFAGEPIAARDGASTFARVRDNIGTAENHLRAARKTARSFEQATRQFADRRIIQALEAVIRGRGRGQETAERIAVGGLIDERTRQQDERAYRLGRIASHIHQAGNNLDAVGRAHRGFEHAGQQRNDRAFIRALSAVIQRYGRDPQAQQNGRESGQGGNVSAAYVRHILAPARSIDAKPRSERDQFTYVARVQDAAKVIGGERVEWRSGRPQKADPWAEQEKIRLAWRKIATDLRATGVQDDIALAGDVDAFVDRMPAIRTQQQEIAAKLLDIRSSRRIAQEGPMAKPSPAPRPVSAPGKKTQNPGNLDRPRSENEPGRER